MTDSQLTFTAFWPKQNISEKRN